MSTFNFTTNILTFETIQGWEVETVEAFLKFKQKDFSLSDAEIQKFVDGSVNGPMLLEVNRDDLISLLGLRLGPALNVSAFAENLKNQSRCYYKNLEFNDSHGEFKDNTSEYCRQIATPFEAPPNISELKSVLLQPFNLKIPLSQILYNKCEVWCGSFPISEYFVECDKEDACYPEKLSNYCYVALQGGDVCSSEFSRNDWDNLLCNPTSVLRQHFKTNYPWKAYRNTEDSSITLAGLRPDYWECFHDVLVFKGEEKSTEDGFIDAKRELISKMRAWNRCLYGDLKYILAYAAGGAKLQFYAIDPSFNLHLISDILDLGNLMDRVKRTYGDVFITDSEVEKRITSFSAYPFSNITVLTNIYRNTKNNRNIIHAVRGPQIVNDSYKIILAPVGIRRMPITEQEVKAAIRCVLNALVDLHELGYVHRDIGWQNILQLTDNNWMLIDLECAGIDDQVVNFEPLNDWAPEVIETNIYTKKGRCLYELEFRLTAQEARQHPWLSNI
ncbi:15244_t:CDS:2 [Gigaspora rosea]|nr:15244_t:CDS:2 [Gigaspora rosea]